MMHIEPLLESLGVDIRRRGDQSDLCISAIVDDSRHASPGCLFIARLGERTDGRAYTADAIAAGAVAVLSDDHQHVPPSVMSIQSGDVAATGAILAARFHGSPSRALKLIGITGTNGKSTTAHLVHQLLNGAGIRCGLIGTISVDDGLAQSPAELTTPSAIQLSSLLRRMVDYGCRACVMEVSSHALQQQRVAGLDFDVAMFTNLSGDHLDYHGSMDAYAAAKARLFRQLPADGVAIVNADDPRARCMEVECRGAITRCSVAGGPRNDIEVCANIVRSHVGGASVDLRGPWGVMSVDLPLVGEHNVRNAMQAVAAAHGLGVDSMSIASLLARCTAPPGRYEPVRTSDDDPTVLVDYAHTDHALANALLGLRPIVPGDGRLRVVFGCGGDRDRTKRPRMAEVACSLADDVIITSDNPRTEDPGRIVDDVIQGVPHEHANTVHVEVDRRVAIHYAISRAQPHDVVLIAGKGHEDYQILGTQRVAFDDRIVAREALTAARGEVAAV